MENYEQEKFEVLEPEMPETKPEEKERQGEPLFEAVRENMREMRYEREDLERDAISGLNEIEQESGLSREEIEKARQETGVLSELAEIQADAELAETYAKESAEQDIYDAGPAAMHEYSQQGRALDLESTRPKPSKLHPEGERRRKLKEQMTELERMAEEKGIGSMKQPFSPEYELRKIRQANRGEQRELLEEWKRKFTSHRIDLAEAQEEVVEMIRENPDVFSDKDERFSILSDISIKYGFSTPELFEMSNLARKYAEKHRAVREFREAYPDDEETYLVAFGKPPYGNVEVIEGPMTLYFRCYDERDYALIERQRFFNQNAEVTQEDINIANMSRGVSITTALHPELAGAIIAENAKGPFDDNAQETYKHEEQHAVNKVFGPIYGKTYSFRNVLEGNEGTDRERALKTYLRKILRDPDLERTKDEIIAYFKGGTHPREIFNVLAKTWDKGGLYDYWGGCVTDEAIQNMHRHLANELGDAEKVPENLEEIMVDIFRKEYRQMLGEAIASYLEFKNRGYSDEQVAAMLLQEPMTKWKKAVDRLIKGVNAISQENEPTDEKELAESGEISSNDIKRWQLLNIKEKGGVKLKESEKDELEDIEGRARQELNTLIGLDFIPETILKNNTALDTEIAFLERWNKLADYEQIEALARADRLLQMADWSDEELKNREYEIIRNRTHFSIIAENSISRVKSAEPLTEQDEQNYNELLEMGPDVLISERIRELYSLSDKILYEKSRLLGPGAPVYGNRDMLGYRMNGEEYLSYLKEWKEKTPEERERVLGRIKKLERMLADHEAAIREN